MQFYKEKHNIDYDAIHAELYKKYFDIHNRLSNWNAADFQGVIADNVFYKFQDDGEVDFTSKGEEVKAESEAGADKMILQNYGRPYENGKPKGTYYKYAKKELKFF